MVRLVKDDANLGIVEREALAKTAFAAVVMIFCLGLAIAALALISNALHERSAVEVIRGGQLTVGIVVRDEERKFSPPEEFAAVVEYRAKGGIFQTTTLPSGQILSVGTRQIISYDTLNPSHARDLSQPRKDWGLLLRLGIAGLVLCLIVLGFTIRFVMRSRMTEESVPRNLW